MPIRPFQPADLEALTGIYNHFIMTGHATFDTEVFTTQERVSWLGGFDGERYQCWVAEEASTVVGYACSQPFKAKAAYQTSVEVSVYVAEGQGGRGIGRALYKALLPALAEQDLHRAYAGVAQPNDASMRLHQTFGFETVSRLTEVGRKFDRYWDVVWLELAL